MGVPEPTRDKAEGERHTVSPDVERASRVSESQEADVQDLPRNEAPRQRSAGGADYDPRLGETAAQDRTPSADDINLEATLLQRSTYPPSVEDWRQAQRRFEPGVEQARSDRVEADETDPRTAGPDDPDAT